MVVNNELAMVTHSGVRHTSVKGKTKTVMKIMNAGRFANNE